jgi:hypothetical protein
MSFNDLHTGMQFSVFLINKPGILARVVQRLADHKVNIEAITMMDSTEHGVLRMVVEKHDVARSALRNMDLMVTETQVLMTSMPNRPGSLADVVERLARAHIEVHYAYCTTGSRNGKALGIFKVSNVGKAMTVLGERRPTRKGPPATARSAKARG